MPSLARTGVHYPYPGIQEKIDDLFEGEGGIAPIARLVDVAKKTIWTFLQAYWVADWSPLRRATLPCTLYGCLMESSAQGIQDVVPIGCDCKGGTLSFLLRFRFREIERTGLTTTWGDSGGNSSVFVAFKLIRRARLTKIQPV